MNIQKGIIVFVYVFIAVSALAIFSLANKIGHADSYTTPMLTRQIVPAQQ